jgi:hypothetical protein
MTLTSVKVQSDLFEDFKMSCVKHKFSLQKLVDRTFIYILQMKNLENQFTITII